MAIKHQNEVAKERWNARKQEPYVPATLSAGTGNVEATLRVAHAIEYIAAQMGEINAKLTTVLERRSGEKS